MEEGEGGWVLLDEMGELGVEVEGKVLGVVEENEVVGVGGRKGIRVDVGMMVGRLVDVGGGGFGREEIKKMLVGKEGKVGGVRGGGDGVYVWEVLYGE